MSLSNIISIASGKGGVGKTWFSVTLGHALAQAKKKVLLVDGDFGLANLDVQLGLASQYDLGNVMTGLVEIHEAITTCEPAPGDSFDVLAGRSGSGVLSVMTDTETNSLYQGVLSLASCYDYVILDLAAGLDRTTLALCDHGGPTIVLLNSEPTSLTDAYAFIKLLHLRNPETDMRVVVNSVRSPAESKNTYTALANACTNFLKTTPSLLGDIPFDLRVREAVKNQRSLLFQHPQSDAAIAIRRIAAKLGQTVFTRPSKVRAGLDRA